jgi:trans-aconitate methyltransferase
MKLINSITRCYNKLPPFGKTLIFLVVILILFTFFKRLVGGSMYKEGFIHETNFLFKDGQAVYDDFYANVYDHLTYDQIKNDYEIGIVINTTFANEASVIADIGCGTGHQVNDLHAQNLQVIGIDESPSMIQKAKENYPNLQFKVGSGLDGTLFQPSSLTHVLCLYYTVYYMKNKHEFFSNCMEWLMPGGYFIVHLVDRYKIHPFANRHHPLYVARDPSAKQTFKIKFDDLVYTSNYKLDVTNDIATVEEKFKLPNGKIRKQEQTLYIEDISAIVKMVQNVGFLLHAKINMMECSYENQYVYVFVKPS